MCNFKQTVRNLSKQTGRQNISKDLFSPTKNQLRKKKRDEISDDNSPYSVADPVSSVINSPKHRRKREEQKEQAIVKEEVETCSKHCSLVVEYLQEIVLVRCPLKEKLDWLHHRESEELFWKWMLSKVWVFSEYF